MQRIVGLLVFQTPEPQPIMQVSPWIDRRFPEPVEAMVARIEAQSHRRFLKSHLPFDGQPIYVRISRIRLSDWLHLAAVGGAPMCIRRSRSTPSFPKTSRSGNCRVPREGTLCRRVRNPRTAA
jgi:hypothetical protein